MNTINYNDYSLTVTGSYSFDNMTNYNVTIESPARRTAKAIITGQQGEYNLLDIQFDQAIGLHGICLFVNGLSKIANELLPMAVNAYEKDKNTGV